MGWWVIVNHVGSVLFLSIDLIVVNTLFGAIKGGEYAIALQWVVLLRAIATTISGVLTPIVLTYYAKEQTDKLVKVSRSAVKLMGLAMALPIGLVCGFAPVLLSVWVGSEFSFLAPLMVVLTGHLAINLAVMPLFSINVAFNRVKIPGVLTLLMGVCNLLLAIILSLYSGLDYYGVAIAAAIILTLKNAFFTPWYATYILGISKHTFTSAMLPGIIATIFIGGSAVAISLILPVTSFLPLVIAGGVLAVIYLVITWLIGFDEFERGLFLSYLPISVRRLVE